MGNLIHLKINTEMEGLKEWLVRDRVDEKNTELANKMPEQSFILSRKEKFLKAT
jgi:hypothetical protein